MQNILTDFRFFEFFNVDHFRGQFTTLKQSLQKKVTFHDDRLEKMKILFSNLSLVDPFWEDSYSGFISNFKILKEQT